MTPSRLLLVLGLLFCLIANAGQPGATAGYGPWRLGMSREQVASAASFGPYSPVAVTGGLETLNGLFAGRKTTISFVFSESGLRKIQLWVYEGPDRERALAALRLIHDYLSREYGSLEAPSLSLRTGATSEQVLEALRARLAEVPVAEPLKIQIAPGDAPPGQSVFASFLKHPQYGYYVFLYHQEP